MKLIVGLGNPGSEYQNSRHNLGFITIDYLAEQLGLEFNKHKFFAEAAEGHYHGQKLLLLKPQTYMNRSGQAVSAAVDFYKIPHKDILIISDDMDMACGQLRLRQKGSAGGHNGLKDIIAHLGNDNQISRCKLGINHPLYGDTVNHVLGAFSDEEKDLLRPAVREAAAAAVCWLEKGIVAAMNEFNGKRNEPPHKIPQGKNEPKE